ncbi:hypothetical protein PVAND_001530 [Polypedilum vanderplanki]|uniref:Ig-like domain-containing protein n=1 Tax=Polypedilum vanderplanki TaxID=319348 RepID=A0A9J6BNP4_POLVA|nr:hypothetical protein PVAND_001530 [Polypedilum vanderplanki]
MMTMEKTYQIVLILLLYTINLSLSVHLTDIQIPEYADIRDIVTLSCSYRMGRNKLNSVKWYKDDREFFRYAPLMDQQISTWTVVGITLYSENPYRCNKTTCSVSLDNLSSMSSGIYRCEISADAPSFTINFSDQRMTIVALPRHDPIIQGLNPIYSMDEMLEANCTTASYPPAVIIWHINGILMTAERAQLTQYEIQLDIRDLQVRSRTMEIQYRIASRGQLFLKCTADIELLNVKRQTSELVYIRKIEKMSNLRLINSAYLS